MTEPICIRIFASLISKKNQYSKRRGRGKGMFKDAALQAKLDYIMNQIPAEYRGLNLIHPDVTYQLILPPNTKHSRPWSRDWDGLITTVQDCLVTLRVFKDDKLSDHNGHKHIPPAIVGDSECVVITIRPAVEGDDKAVR